MKESEAVDALDRAFELTARLSGLMQRGLTERGLTIARATVLHTLAQRGPAVQRELSETLRCTPRHVTGLVDLLEERGWVVRRPHPTDRRARLVELTEQGAAVAARMDAERRAAAGELFGDVSAADLAAFVLVADRVLERIGGDGRLLDEGEGGWLPDDGEEGQPPDEEAQRTSSAAPTPDRTAPSM